MTISLTIPDWVLWIPVAYYVLGALLLPPSAIILGRYISPRQDARTSLRWLARKPLRTLVAPVAWPAWVWYVAKYIVKYGWR